MRCVVRIDNMHYAYTVYYHPYRLHHHFAVFSVPIGYLSSEHGSIDSAICLVEF